MPLAHLPLAVVHVDFHGVVGGEDDSNVAGLQGRDVEDDSEGDFPLACHGVESVLHAEVVELRGQCDWGTGETDSVLGEKFDVLAHGCLRTKTAG